MYHIRFILSDGTTILKDLKRSQNNHELDEAIK